MTPLKWVDLSRAFDTVQMKLFTDAGNLDVGMTPAEAIVIATALTEYASDQGRTATTPAKARWK